jgi:tetratricopeptide (TPR) repeat protein
MKKLFLLTLLALLGTNFCMAKGEKTKVITLATIHGFHNQSKYTYEDIVRAIDTYKPDLICVEIRPEEFRTKTYLQEMMYATAYGDQNKIAVAPIDWYVDDAKGTDKVLRDSLMKLDRYKDMQKKLDSLESASEILKAFTAKYGQNVLQRKDLGFEFYNGDEFNGCNRENYRLSISVFGDSPVNLSAITRNKNMVQRVNDAIKKYKAKRVVVLAGYEHKSFIDDYLKENAQVEVLSACSILPLNECKIGNVVANASASQYFTKVDSSEYDKFYDGMISSLLLRQHLRLNFSDEMKKDVVSIGKALQNWQKDAPASTSLKYNKAWYCLLTKEYDKAIEYANAFLQSPDLEKQVIPDFFAYRLLGFCYDMKNDRTSALESYTKGKSAMAAKKINEQAIKMVFEKYENSAFTF